MSDIAITVQNLGKLYRIGGKQERYKRFTETIMDTLTAPLRRLRNIGRPTPETEILWALKDISFEIKQGEAVGIIGRNGAGKSTLLKILSRITEPTEGEARIRGRVGSLLEVGTGFHPELTGRENIYLNGTILGMKRAEINRKFDEIVDFAEIEKFLDTPVKRYSSGMYVRLAFAVAAHLEPEVLVVDEVLAVGDAQFQKKCLGKMGEVAQGGRTVLFVSHNMGAISQLCKNTLWLERGCITGIGTTPAIIASYLKGGAFSTETGEAIFAEDPRKEAQLRRARFLNQEQMITQKFSCDEPVIIELLFQVNRCTPNLYGYLDVSTLDGTRLLVSYSHDTPVNPLDGLPVGMYSIYITLPPRILGHGEYNVYLSFAHTSGQFMIDAPEVVGTFSLDDVTSKSGNTRSGFLSTLLPWQVQCQ